MKTPQIFQIHTRSEWKKKANKHGGGGDNMQNILLCTSESVNAWVDILLQDKNQPSYQAMWFLSLIYINNARTRPY